MADENRDFPEYEAWVKKQSAFARWAIRTRAAIADQDETNNAEYLRHVAKNMIIMKEESYLWSSSAQRPDDYYKGRSPLTAAYRDHGMFKSPYEIRAKELRGELIRWNHWHSWDLKPSATTSYPKPPAKYDPLNPTRPNIRKQRLEREAAH